MDLAILKRLDSAKVQDRHVPVFKEREGVLSTGSRGWSNNIGSWDLGTGVGSYMRRHQMDVPGASPEVYGIR